MVSQIIRNILKKHLRVTTRYIEPCGAMTGRIVTSLVWDNKIISQYVQELEK